MRKHGLHRFSRITPILISVIGSSVLSPISVYGFNKTGSSAAQFLKIGVGARAPAMGNSFVAVADDATALYWNPAGIAKIKTATLTGAHTMLFANISHEFIGFVLPARHGAIGFSGIFLNSGEMEITTIEEPEGTGATFNYGCLSLGTSYARYLTDRFITGVSLKYIRENAHNEKASTFALDIGTLLQTDFLGMRIGMCMSNFGGTMKLEGRDLITSAEGSDTRLETSSWSLPLNFRVGIATDIVGIGSSFIESEIHRFTAALDANHSNDNVERVSLGMEYQVAGTILVRGGYRFNSDEGGLSFGGGIKTDIAERFFEINYALTDFGHLGDVHRFSIEIGL